MELFLRGRSVIVLLAEEALELRLLLALLVELMEVLLDVVFELVQLSGALDSSVVGMLELADLSYDAIELETPI